MIEVPVVLSYWAPDLHTLKAIVGAIASNYETVFESSYLFSVPAVLAVADPELRSSSCHFCFCFSGFSRWK